MVVTFSLVFVCGEMDTENNISPCIACLQCPALDWNAVFICGFYRNLNFRHFVREEENSEMEQQQIPEDIFMLRQLC